MGNLIYLVLTGDAPGLSPAPHGEVKHVRPELVEEEDVAPLGHLEDGNTTGESGHNRLFTGTDLDDGACCFPRGLVQPGLLPHCAEVLYRLTRKLD